MTRILGSQSLLTRILCFLGYFDYLNTLLAQIIDLDALRLSRSSIQVIRVFMIRVISNGDCESEEYPSQQRISESAEYPSQQGVSELAEYPSQQSVSEFLCVLRYSTRILC